MAKRTTKKPEIEVILAEISEGETYRDIAKRLKTPLSTLHDFLSNPEHSARVELAQEMSAHTYYDLAEEALKAISDDAKPGEIARQRELAQLYTKKAGKRNPKKYGDKIQQEHSGEITTITPPSFVINQPKSTESKPSAEMDSDFM